jgi:ABC-2 type transport system permease protein
MRVVKSIFIKQLDDMMKNPMVTSIFILIPFMAWLMIRFQGIDDPEAIMLLVVSLAMMSVASMPITAITTYIAEDVETHSLRFLIMAGVKPAQYLAGLAIFSMLLAALAMVAFGFIGQLSAGDFPMFLGITLIGCLTSLVLGAILGLVSKSIQQASIYTTIFGLGLGFLPMLSLQNPALLGGTFFLYTQQVFMTLMYMTFGRGQEAIEIIYYATGYNFSIGSSLMIIGANMVVLLVIFAVLYKKRGLRG